MTRCESYIYKYRYKASVEYIKTQCILYVPLYVCLRTLKPWSSLLEFAGWNLLLVELFSKYLSLRISAFGFLLLGAIWMRSIDLVYSYLCMLKNSSTVIRGITTNKNIVYLCFSFRKEI